MDGVNTYARDEACPSIDFCILEFPVLSAGLSSCFSAMLLDMFSSGIAPRVESLFDVSGDIETHAKNKFKEQGGIKIGYTIKKAGRWMDELVVGRLVRYNS